MNRIMKKTILLICLLITGVLYAQENFLSIKLSQGHPRYLTDNKGKAETQKLIKEEPWAQEVFEKLSNGLTAMLTEGLNGLLPACKCIGKLMQRRYILKENIMIMQEERRRRLLR